MIALLESTVPYLKQLKESQERAGLTLDKVCVWPSGKRVRPDYISAKFKKLIKKIDLPNIRLHDLRHTTSSLLAPTVSPVYLKDFMGHKDIATTLNIYTHIMDEGKRQTASAMNDIVSKLLPCSEPVRNLQVLEGGKSKAEPPAVS